MSKEGIESALAKIEKAYGKGAIMKWGDKPDQEISAISTSCISLDRALGVGGLPRGRIIEAFGPESSGKTTLALQVVANSQKEGKIAAYVDAEHALDPEYAKALGVNVDELLISQPNCGEEGLEIVEALVRSGEVDIIVVDSVAALVPQAELNGEMGDSVMGVHARLMSQACRKLTAIVAQNNVCLIFINQLREKIGVMFGSPEITTGGKALKFYSSIRIDIRRIGAVKEGEEIVGNRTRVKIIKNKVAPPHKQAEFTIRYGEGISKEEDLIDLAIADNIILQKGAWFSYDGKNISQGRANLIKLFKEDLDFYKQIEEEVKTTYAK